MLQWRQKRKGIPSSIRMNSTVEKEEEEDEGNERFLSHPNYSPGGKKEFSVRTECAWHPSCKYKKNSIKCL